MRKKSSSFYYFLLILFLPGLVEAQFQISLTIDKDTFLVDEPIYCLVKETNVSTDTQYTSPYSPHAIDYFQFILTDQSGTELPYRGLVNYYSYRADSPGQPLPPNESFVYKSNLLGMFGVGDSLHGLHLYLPPGNYTLQAKHNTDYHWFTKKRNRRLNKDEKSNNSQSIIYSNQVHFQVAEPTEQEAEIRKQLLILYKWQFKAHNTNDIRETKVIPLVHNLIEKHPESPYSKAAFEVYAVRPEKNILLFRDSIGALVQITNLGIPLSVLLPYSEKYKDTRLAEYVKLLQANDGMIRTNTPVKPYRLNKK